MKLQLLFAQRCCALLFITLFATAAFSQKIKIGLQGGINWAGLQKTVGTYDKIENSARTRFGGQVNLFLEKQFGAHPFSLSAEPGVFFKGYSEIVNDRYYPRSAVIFRLVNANLPLVFNYFPVKRLGLSIGTEFNYMLRAYENGENNQFFLDNLNRFEVAGLAGVQYSLTKNWTFGVRYTHGITPVQIITITDADGNPDGELVQRNMTGKVFVRYVLN